MERRLRSSNLEFKGQFPETAVRDYAATLLGENDDALVLGHFHLELDLAPPPHRVLVLPEWKGSRRHLRVTPDGGDRVRGLGVSRVRMSRAGSLGLRGLASEALSG